jgi:hypothetical protein
MKKTYAFTLAALVAAAALTLIVPGCTTTGDDPQVKIQKVSQVIQIGASSTTSIGLLAIPNADEADEIAELALDVLDKNILPILNGDEAGIVAGLDRLMDLSVFNNPKLEKLRMVLETALPLLRKNIPGNLIDQGLDRIPDDVKAYLNAFFNGIHDGLEAYLGEGGRAGSKFEALRKRLAE